MRSYTRRPHGANEVVFTACHACSLTAGFRLPEIYGTTGVFGPDLLPGRVSVAPGALHNLADALNEPRGAAICFADELLRRVWVRVGRTITFCDSLVDPDHGNFWC